MNFTRSRLRRRSVERLLGRAWEIVAGVSFRLTVLLLSFGSGSGTGRGLGSSDRCPEDRPRTAAIFSCSTGLVNGLRVARCFGPDGPCGKGRDKGRAVVGGLVRRSLTRSAACLRA